MIREQIDYFLNSEKGRNATAVFVETLTEWKEKEIKEIFWDMFKYSTLWQDNEGFRAGGYMEKRIIMYELVSDFFDTIFEVDKETNQVRHEELKQKLCP